jgi:hypothetical protein
VTLTLHKFLTAGDFANPMRALNTHGQTGTCLEHGSQLSSGKGHAGISPQASGQRDQKADRPAVGKQAIEEAMIFTLHDHGFAEASREQVEMEDTA